jgi:hypothetical protein
MELPVEPFEFSPLNLSLPIDHSNHGQPIEVIPVSGESVLFMPNPEVDLEVSL